MRVSIQVLRCVAPCVHRLQPSPKCFLVSDAMPTVGGPDAFQLYDMIIHVEDGRLINADGNLAGAHTTMARSVARLISHVGASLETALRMSITTPAHLMKRPDLASIAGRRTADCVILSQGGVFIGGLGDL